MVGSRQVTLSVARQLDEVDWEVCKPFGRIRYTRNDEPELAIIGQDPEGNLCRSSINWDELRIMSARLRNNKPHSWFSGDGLNGGHYVTNEEYEGWVNQHKPLLERYRRQKAEFEALPLIVLAGLK